MKRFLLPVCFAIMLFSCKETNESIDVEEIEEVEEIEKKEMTEAEKIADAYGYDNWERVKEIKFTFNVKSGENKPFQRHWTWNPKTEDVTMMTSQDTVSYNRTSMDSTAIKADQAFINDKYWLLTPFQFVWDEGTTISEPAEAESPMDSTMMKKITLTYGSEGGYTPGDAYDIYYGDDYKVKQWVFRKGNDTVPSMMTTWENEETINGITVAKDHKMPGRNIYFTDVEIEMAKKE